MNKFTKNDYNNKANIKIEMQTANTVLINVEINSKKYESKYDKDFLNYKLRSSSHFTNLSSFYTCLIDNIKEKKLEIKNPYEMTVNTIWKIDPKGSKNQQDSLTLVLYQIDFYKLSLFFFSNLNKANEIIDYISTQETNSPKVLSKKDNPFEMIYQNSFLIKKIICLDNIKNKAFIDDDFINNKLKIDKKADEYGKILIFIDQENLIEIIMEIIDNYYDEDFFVIIINTNNNNKSNSEDFKLTLEFEINKLTDTQKAHFDINNIYFFDTLEKEKIYISLLKIYNYFNQLGDEFFRELLENPKNKINGLKEEFNYLFNTHYFNILLWGETGAGKSTFINAFIGEKKTYTQCSESTGTKIDNYYIHKKYPIKIIDVCGFSKGNESNIYKEKINNIYNKKSHNITIDKNDVFTYSLDKRNNIHLFLYFNKYMDKLDVKGALSPVVNNIIQNKIHMIFIVSKCPEKLFTNEKEMKCYLREINKIKIKTEYEKYEYICIDSISKNGFDNLCETIYNYFKKYLIEDSDLNILKINYISKDKLSNIINNSIFIRNKNIEANLIDYAIQQSIIKIKTLLVHYFGYYENNLRLIPYFRFSFSIFKNYWFSNKNNSFPLLTNLTKKIFENFGKKKDENECNSFIKKLIKKYFKIDKISQKNDNRNTIKDQNNDDNVGTDDEEEIEHKDEEKEKEKKAIKVEFDKNNFIKDYSILFKLFWDSGLNFGVGEGIESNLLDISEKSENYNDKIFSEKFNLSTINTKDILNYVKKFFGIVEVKEEVNLPPKIEMKLILFFISYISNELINILCGNIKYKGFKYKSVCDFYYNVLKSYNEAINGFNDIRKKILEEKEKLSCKNEDFLFIGKLKD